MPGLELYLFPPLSHLHTLSRRASLSPTWKRSLGKDQLLGAKLQTHLGIYTSRALWRQLLKIQKNRREKGIPHALLLCPDGVSRVARKLALVRRQTEPRGSSPFVSYGTVKKTAPVFTKRFPNSSSMLHLLLRYRDDDPSWRTMDPTSYED